MGGPSKEHEEMVAKLIEAGATKGKLRARVAMWLTDPEHPRIHNWEPSFQTRLVKEAMEYRRDRSTDEDDYGYEDDEDQPIALTWYDHYVGLGCQKNPDAFRFDGDVLTVFEVVKTSDIDPSLYAEMWSHIDCCDFGMFQLQVISHHGGATHTYGQEEFFALMYGGSAK